MKIAINNKPVLAALFLAALLVGGCASGSKPDAMVAQIVAPVHKVDGDVSIAVSGGKETSKMGASQISNDAFAQALRDSIQKAGLFSSVAADGARYRLTAFIGKVDQPTFGFSFTVKMEVSYALKDTKSGSTVWTKDINSEHTATAGQAFAGVERLRLANEGAARENIRQALTELGALTL
ncbi:MAG TPA: hypothetical protein VHU43_06960 [Steroidobacteraceae bacterium]|nr:hypothetical protein [Steroidobacteraceae bacterium]